MAKNKVGPASNITPKHGVRNPQSEQVKIGDDEESYYEFESFEEEFEEEIEEEKAKPNTEGDNASGSIKFTDVNEIQKTFRTGAQGTDMSKIKGLTLKSKKTKEKLQVQDIYSDDKLSDKDDKAPSYYDEDEEYESEEAELEDEEGPKPKTQVDGWTEKAENEAATIITPKPEKKKKKEFDP